MADVRQIASEYVPIRTLQASGTRILHFYYTSMYLLSRKGLLARASAYLPAAIRGARVLVLIRRAVVPPGEALILGVISLSPFIRRATVPVALACALAATQA